MWFSGLGVSAMRKLAQTGSWEINPPCRQVVTNASAVLSEVVIGKRCAVCRSHPRLVPMNRQSGIPCDPATLVLYRRCQASSRPHVRSREGESRRTLSEPFSPFESKLVQSMKTRIIHTCKEYPGAQLRSVRCCSWPAQKEDRKCNLRNPKSRSRLSKWSSAGASLESAVSSSNPLIVIRCANGIRSILDSLTKAKA